VYKLFATVLALTAAGCATPYQSGTFSLTGGFYESVGPGRLEKIAFSGNGFINADTVEQYTLYRCAEAAKSRNKSHFLIFDSLIQASIGKPSERPNVGSVGGKPTGFAFVLFLDGPQPGARETDKVLRELEAVVKQNQTEPKS